MTVTTTVTCDRCQEIVFYPSRHTLLTKEEQPLSLGDSGEMHICHQCEPSLYKWIKEGPAKMAK